MDKQTPRQSGELDTNFLDQNRMFSLFSQTSLPLISEKTYMKEHF